MRMLSKSYTYKGKATRVLQMSSDAKHPVAMSVGIDPSYIDGEYRMLDVYKCTQSLSVPWFVVKNLPEHTASVAMKVLDITVGFTHWIAWNVGTPEETNGTNSFGRQNYSAPCPPKDGRTHKYVITAYALRERPGEFHAPSAVTSVLFDRVVARYQIGVASTRLYYGV